jgi:Fe-S cluster assembly ATP-binding protein
MLKINNLSVKLSENNKEILQGITIEINPGEIHLINGNNGSGKSTLVNAIMGNPSFEITKGSVTLENENYSEFVFEKLKNDDEEIVEVINKDVINITNLEPNAKSLLGLFLANQYPMEIPGVSLTNYLRLIYNIRRSKEEQLPVFKFRKLLEEKASLINYPKHLLARNLNEGFSGGEKKKTEILQMLILEPRYIMLDEIDSGLDRNSVKEVFEGLAKFKEINPKTSFIVITHYDKVQEYLKIDHTHEMESGKLKD